MKKETKRENEVITRRILNEELGKTKSELRRDIKRETGKLREEMHTVEFRLIKRMDDRFDKIDDRFNQIDDVLKNHLDAVRGLADKVIVKHNNFEVESASIHHNYRTLEERVHKVEEVVFPQAA